MANKEIVSVCSSDGHHLIWVALEHLLHRLHLFLAVYTNFYSGAVNFDGTSVLMVFVIGKTETRSPTLGQNKKTLFPGGPREEELRGRRLNEVIPFMDFIFIIKCKLFA